MTVIDVDTDEYAAAASQMATVAGGFGASVSDLSGALGASSGMGGSDHAGVEWAHAYDESARSAMQAAAGLVNGTGQIAQLLHASGANHAHADASSISGGGGGSDFPAAPAPAKIGQQSVPSAAGGSGGGPPGWSLVQGLVGYAWPNGHQDRLHAAQAAWNAAASGLTSATSGATSAAAKISAQRSPEVESAAAACTQANTQTGELAGVFRQIGSSCADYAAHLDHAHHEIISTLKDLVEQTAIIEGVGGFFAVFTGGMDEIAAQAAVYGRILKAAAKIRTVIEALIEAARGVAASIRGFGAKALEVVSKMKPFEEAVAKRAGVDEAESAVGATKELTQSEKLAIDYGDLNELYRTKPGTAYFWSGRTSQGAGVGPIERIDGSYDSGIAAKVAEERGGVTLETLQEQRGVIPPKWDGGDPAVVKWWSDHSAAYANNTSGEVHAVLGSSLRSGNVWETVELPRLINNNAVTKITTMNPETGNTSVILER
ncbi:hypothetical protein GCM10027169_16190 [Gordonia jinhuaensis]|uniref:Outer membrane channel protein CpnT-like N-terminal domain-containing protein n=1 Tax=Gordonia jinhuaensis TaxID=1517702 RepID=A0A916X1R7_9ACTN|nr:hypothetical protein [Gordonia jinhuaensis]GGB48577.1 hypothetical protein GCM10011489_39640 [Gordonia jinhuaensis]